MLLCTLDTSILDKVVKTVCSSSGRTNSMNNWVKTYHKGNCNETKKMGWENDQIGIILVRPNISEIDFCIFKLRERLESEELNPKFDFETLSSKWPVVIICLPNGKNDDLSIAQSRAIAKIVYIQPPTDIADGSQAGPFLINIRVSHLSLTTTYLKTRYRFYQHFTSSFIVKKLFVQIFCTFI